MGHGFDDQGSKYDADGNLKELVDGSGSRAVEARAACIVNQFDSIEVGGVSRARSSITRENLVTGEAMGDLGGATLAYKAYHRSLMARNRR